MSYGLYISAEGAMAQSQRLETIANNLANVDSAGFKRDLAVFRARYAEEIEQGLDVPGSRSTNEVGGGVMVQAALTDYSPGAYKRTEIPTDLAITGEGFFVVQKGEQNVLTRAGNFMLTNTGTLVTQQGYPVLSDTGIPVVIDPTQGPWQITADGAIHQAGNITNLAVVQPQSLGDLAKLGENLFLPLAQPHPVPPAARQVQAGYLELSGVKPTTEMMEMIEASRAFEANVNLIRNQDQMFGQLISRLLRA
jgi:flagellar basal-body rod protein FlgF/flagellar basal-body rod protein FlgG